MRRFLIGLTALAVCAYPLPLLAAPPPEEPPPEDELVLDEDDMDAAPAETTDAGPGDTSFLDEGEEGGDAGAEVGGSGDGSAADVNVSLSEEDQRKADERDITVIQPQAFLNVYTD